MKVEIREIQHGSPEYRLEIQLRMKVLREPLGLSFTEKDLATEPRDFHVGAFSGPQLIGCLVLTPLSDRTIKMRQVAVDSSAQRSGIGRQLVTFCEGLCARHGFEVIELHARETAVAFYLAQSYELYGEPFEEVTIPHRKMRKRLR